MAEKELSKEKAASGDSAEREDNGSSKGAGKSLSRRAARSLRRARQSYQNNEWENSSEGAFHMQEANVLALMDLAEAVRETRGSGDPTPS